MTQLIFMDSGCPSIYMPVGSIDQGGTCEFSTEKCRDCCPSGMVSNEMERTVLQFFKNNNAEIIIEQMWEEFKEIQKNPRTEKMIQWWTWGDCLAELTNKVASVILGLNNYGVPQYGFTRNKELWKTIPSYDDLHIGLTCDDIYEAFTLSLASGKMTASPDYETGYAQMIFSGKVRAKCSGWWCITEKGETRASDCTQCYASGEGCYYR